MTIEQAKALKPGDMVRVVKPFVGAGSSGNEYKVGATYPVARLAYANSDSDEVWVCQGVNNAGQWECKQAWPKRECLELADQPDEPGRIGVFASNSDTIAKGCYLRFSDKRKCGAANAGDVVVTTRTHHSGKYCLWFRNITPHSDKYGKSCAELVEAFTYANHMYPEAPDELDAPDIDNDIADPSEEEQVTTNEGEHPMSDNPILNNPVTALREQPDDDTVILRKANMENTDGTPSGAGETAVLADLYRERRAGYAQKLRDAIKADEAAENGETTSK